MVWYILGPWFIFVAWIKKEENGEDLLGNVKKFGIDVTDDVKLYMLLCSFVLFWYSTFLLQNETKMDCDKASVNVRDWWTGLEQ